MKLTRTLLIVLCSCTLIWSCRKSSVINSSQPISLIDSSKIYFETQVRSSQTRDVKNSSSPNLNDTRKALLKNAIWEKAKIVDWTSGKVVIVPIHYNKPFIVNTNFSGENLYSLNNLSRLLIYKDKSKNFHAEVITYFPDSSYSSNKKKMFSGIAVIENWHGDLLKEYKYNGDGKILKLDLSNTGETGYQANSTVKNQSIIRVCYEISGYNYSPVNDEYTYWSYSAGCSSMFLPDDNGGGDGGSGGNPGGGDYGGGSYNGGGGSGSEVISSEQSFTIVSGPDIINNINEYTKCFTNTAGNTHSYNVTLCVAQPEEGSRGTWIITGGGSSGNNGLISIGHTFLILSESTPTGTITRNIGFYPSGNVTPLSVESQGQLNNDANHEYNISLTVGVTGSEFAQILNFIAQGNNSGFMYNLNSNNCTTFAINALGSGGIYIPRTTGSWLNGGGLNPGDLGEDIREMQLAPNMTRTTISGTHPNIGTCY